MQVNSLILYADGGARSNPGPAAFGFVIYSSDGTILLAKGETIGNNTNNVAEYMGLIGGLSAGLEIFPQKEIEMEVRMDSLLVVRQMRGEFKIKQPHLQVLAEKARSLARLYKKIVYKHIPREQNKEADKMVNLALDGKL